MLSTINENKSQMTEKMPGSQIFNVRENVTVDDVLFQPFPQYQNPDRWALLSCFEEKKGGGCHVKIHGLFPHRQQAENVGRNAVENGYLSKCVVADTRSWLRFPIQSVESEVNVNAALKAAVGIEINRERSELDRLRTRVENSRKESPTTAYGRYLQLVSEGAKELIEALNEDEAIDLQEKFEAFRKKELAKISNPPLPPELEQHFRKKIAAASLQDKQAARNMHSAGMGMPSIM